MSQYVGSPLEGRTEKKWWSIVLTDDQLLDAVQVCAALDVIMDELGAGELSITVSLEADVSLQLYRAEMQRLTEELGAVQATVLAAIIQARVSAREDREIARMYLGELLRERRLTKTGPAGDGGEET